MSAVRRLPWVAGAPRATSDVRPVRSPWDGRVVTEVGQADRSLLDEALARAEGARGVMEALPAHARATILERARDGLARRTEELVAAVVDEGGKPVGAARGEIARAAETLTDAAFAARMTTGWLEPLDAVPAGEGRMGLVRRVPVGVVAAITPFNFPVNLVLHKLGPAVAAGCPVVLKPAPETPSAALILAEILHEAGLPAGGLSVLPCDVEVAQALVADPRVAFLSFTGSAAVGWKLKVLAGRARVALELGGNAGVYVAADADLDRAVEACARGGFANAGQSCISVQRVLVHEAVHEAFLARFAAHVRDTVRAGDPWDPGVVVGPLVRDRDADRVEAWIAEAVAGGAQVLVGGVRQGRVLPPTILTGVPPGCRLDREEVFGPVVTVQSVPGDDAALTALDDTAFGLQAAIFTRDVGLLMRAWRTLHVGGIVHDDASAFRADAMPYGGTKDSGLGREGPRHAILELTEPRLLVLRG